MLASVALQESSLCSPVTASATTGADKTLGQTNPFQIVLTVLVTLEPLQEFLE